MIYIVNVENLEFNDVKKKMSSNLTFIEQSMKKTGLIKEYEGHYRTLKHGGIFIHLDEAPIKILSEVI